MHIVSLHNISAIDGSSGGKGKQLALLLTKGLPVPAGFVVATSAFNAFIDGSGICEDLAALAQSTDVVDIKILARRAEEFTLRMDMLPFSEELSQEIATTLEMKAPYGFAVRSSANTEDGARAAWAGQFTTLLSVPRHDVPAAVRKVWRSICSPHALASWIRARATEITMAVVVQTMILPRVSGVLFTTDPVHPDRGRLVVEAVTGHSNALVSGEVTPDHYVLSRNNLRMIGSDVVLPGKPVLSENELTSLAAMGLHIETILGTPVDVEWAYVEDTLTILQARPITSL